MLCVIIPTYKPDGELKEILSRLAAQTMVPDKVLIINTEEKYFDETVLKEGSKLFPSFETVHIKLPEFDHAATRSYAASLCKDFDHIVFMTQDAVPADRDLIANLISPFKDEKVAVSYARQLPKKGCSLIERYTREFNYPPGSFVKGKEDMERLGIKTYFCSDVCAAYDNAKFKELGGFTERAIFNEDMIYAHKATEAGYLIAYAADAKVLHSHDYTVVQQYKRNRDIGITHEMFPEVFGGLKSEGEGIKLVLGNMKYLIKKGRPLLIFKLVILSGAKYLGYRSGRRSAKTAK